MISFTGTGDCFRVYDSSEYGTRTKFGGGFVGITIDGSNAGSTAPSAGLHVGDLLQYELDLTVQNFYQAGGIGIHLDNNYYWTEQLYGRVYVSNCASHVVFDWTTTASSTSSGSFERCDLDVYINQNKGGFDGVVLRNGAFVTNGSLVRPGGLHAERRLAGLAVGELPAVPADLLPQVRLLGLQRGDPPRDLGVVLDQQGQPLGHGALAAAGELGVAAHLRDRHAGVAQAAQHAQPLQVLIAEAPVPAGCAADVVKQADPLVVAQGVEAEARLLGRLAGRDAAVHRSRS